MRARGIAQAAALVTGLTAGSAILGFLRDVVIAGVFGASANLDAYLVSQGLMNLVLALIAGAMAKATVPVLAAQTAEAAGGSSKAGHAVGSTDGDASRPWARVVDHGAGRRCGRHGAGTRI